MDTLNNTLYNIFQYGLGEDTWQEWVDRYAEKYDTFDVEGFDFAPVQISYTFAQLLATSGATSLPAYVDPESPGYETALHEVQGVTGNIPTMKKYYRLNRVVLQEQMALVEKLGGNGISAEMQNVFMKLLDEGTDGLIQSYYNALTHQRHQIVSTGAFTIDTVNNPRGLKGITLQFVNASNISALSGTARWWTNATRTTEGSASDPIKDMKDKVKSIRRDSHYYGGLHIEMAQDLFDDLTSHSKVLTRIGHYLYPTIDADATALSYAQNLADDAIKNAIEKLVGAKIVVRDTYAYVDTPNTDEHDLVQTQIDNFKVVNVAFVPDGKLGDIMGVSPLTLGYDPEKVAKYNDGRLVLSQRAIPETHSIYIESEAAQLCVPSLSRYMFIMTVSA